MYKETLVEVVVALSIVEFPSQIVTFDPAFTGGFGLGVRFTV
jgi:hypothetical protein